MAPVHITGRHFQHVHGMPEVVYDILYDGVKYRCDEQTLKLLYDGADIDDFDLLDPDEDDDD